MPFPILAAPRYVFLQQTATATLSSGAPGRRPGAVAGAAARIKRHPGRGSHATELAAPGKQPTNKGTLQQGNCLARVVRNGGLTAQYTTKLREKLRLRKKYLIGSVIATVSAVKW